MVVRSVGTNILTFGFFGVKGLLLGKGELMDIRAFNYLESAACQVQICIPGSFLDINLL
jgi:hypothetical protein